MSRVFITIGLSLFIIAFGVLAMLGLGAMRQDPAEAAPAERALRVEGIRAEPRDVQVILRQTGEAKAIDVVSVIPEVSGNIVEVHPNLDVGRVIPKGETMFLIDPRTYEANVSQAEAQVQTLTSTIERLKVQFDNDKGRLEVMQRTAELAKAEFDRRRDLLNKDNVGSLSGVEAQEQILNTALEAQQRMQMAVDTYPMQIREAEGSLAAAKAQLEIAQLNLDRTRVKAPFNARIKDFRVVVGQFVSPGQPVLSIANDEVLEISVPLDSSEARQWLAFNDERPGDNLAWFNQLKDVPCTVRWTADKENHQWTGKLDRVERIDSQTRTLTVAVRVEGEEAFSKNGGLPLVDGMFCEVSIPGRTLARVVELPDWAVSFENTVYCSVNNRLKTTPVKVAWKQDEKAYVEEGLEPGTIVVTTRLVNPLENTLLEIAPAEPEAVPAS
ncbi:MAG: hemolysin D [Candidatus Hydrogenedentota bacterium]